MARDRLIKQSSELARERLPLSDKITFSYGVFGKDAANTFVGIYYMFFLTQVLALNAALIGTVFAVSRLIFAFSAPVMGTFIDNTRTKIGKYRPWIMFSALTGSVALFMMFTNMNLAEGVKYLFYLSFYVIWELANLTLDIAVWAFLPTVTHNVDDRNRMTSLAKITSGLGSGIVTAGVPFILSFLYGSEYEPRGYFVLGAIVTAIMLSGGLLVYFLNRERVVTDSDFIQLKNLFKSILDNDQLIAYFVSFLLINMAGSFTNHFAIYFFAFDFGDMRYFGLFTVLAGLGQGIGVFTYPLIAKRMPIRTILIIATLSSIVGYLLMWAVILLFGITNIILFCSISVIMLFSGGWIATASQSMLLDITDYGEYKLGNRTASVVFSANTMMWRIIGSIVVLALGISLSVAGVNGASLEGTVSTSEKGIWLIRIMMFAVPVIFVIIGLVIFASKYMLNDKEMARIQQSLVEKRIKAELKKQRREERKILSLKLREAKRIYRKELYRKNYKYDSHFRFERIKKIYISRIEKRVKGNKDNED